MGGALGVVSDNSLQGIDWWYTPDGLSIGSGLCQIHCKGVIGGTVLCSSLYMYLGWRLPCAKITSGNNILYEYENKDYTTNIQLQHIHVHITA